MLSAQRVCAVSQIEGKGESQHLPLMVAKPEGLAELVFLDELIDEGDGRYAFHWVDATGDRTTTFLPSRWDRKLLLLPINGRLHLKG